MTIRERRKELGITLTDMAKHFGVSISGLSRYETGSRRWPCDLYAQALAWLRLPPQPAPRESWSRARQLEFARIPPWAVETDPGQTWADLPRGYPEFYQRLNPKRSAPLEKRRCVRADSRLEGCVFCELLEAGAEMVPASPVAMNFPHHPLLDERGGPMPATPRMAFHLDDWLLWPQVNILTKVKVRVDMLAFNRKRWLILEWDGGGHKNSEWDKLRDSWLTPPVLRFTEDEILGGKFIPLLREALADPEAFLAKKAAAKNSVAVGAKLTG